MLPCKARCSSVRCRAPRLTGQGVFLLIAMMLCGVSFESSAAQHVTQVQTCSGTRGQTNILGAGYVATCSSSWSQDAIVWVDEPAEDGELMGATVDSQQLANLLGLITMLLAMAWLIRGLTNMLRGRKF